MIAYDKRLHFIGGVILFAIFHFITPLIAIAIVISTAIAKEVYDWFNKDKHTPEVMDAVWTICGGMVGFICWVRL